MGGSASDDGSSMANAALTAFAVVAIVAIVAAFAWKRRHVLRKERAAAARDASVVVVDRRDIEMTGTTTTSTTPYLAQAADPFSAHGAPVLGVQVAQPVTAISSANLLPAACLSTPACVPVLPAVAAVAVPVHADDPFPSHGAAPSGGEASEPARGKGAGSSSDPVKGEPLKGGGSSSEPLKGGGKEATYEKV